MAGLPSPARPRQAPLLGRGLRPLGGGDGRRRWAADGLIHGGELAGVGPTERPVSTAGITIYRVADGRIVEAWSSHDERGMLEQGGFAVQDEDGDYEDPPSARRDHVAGMQPPDSALPRAGAARPATPRVIAYGGHPSQVADLELPTGEGPHPVLVLVHGGFWRTAFDRTLMGPLAADAVRRGWAAWNIEYRRVGDGGGWPSTLIDVADAVDHLAALADEHRLDLAQVVAAGHSAGGHLALWLATRPGLPAGTPGAAPRVAVAGAISQAGVADLRAAEEAGLGGGAVAVLLGGSSAAVPGRYDLASPIERLPVGVPTLCVHGRSDPTVPVSQSEAWVAAARAAGDQADLVVCAGGHHEVLDPGHESWQAIARRVLS